jgi:hypothetical protein
MAVSPYEIYWDAGFEASLNRMNISWETFDRLGRFGVDFLLHADPFEAQATFGLVGDIRYLRTRFRFPDLPAMLIAYEVNEETRTVTIKGAEPVWSADLFYPEA